MKVTIAMALSEGQIRLRQRAGGPNPDAQILLAEALGRPRSHLFAWPERPVEDEQLSRYRDLIQRRADGEPIAYILGRREFWSLDLEVTPATLIPRHETELLVELALGKLPAKGGARVLDLGTGSGAIALALAAERPGIEVVATDSSQDAIAVAQRNARRLGFSDIDFKVGDWFGPISQAARFDLIVSNPPYVAEGDPHLREGDLPWEPMAALVAGPDGLGAIRNIIGGAEPRLIRGGYLMLECGHDQGSEVAGELRKAGFCSVGVASDFAGLDRIAIGRAPT